MIRNLEKQWDTQVSGRVDQSAGMLDDEAREKGYTLLCVSEPQGDCKVAIIDEVCNGCMCPWKHAVGWSLTGAQLTHSAHTESTTSVYSDRHCDHTDLHLVKALMQDEILEQVLCSSG